MLFINQSKAAPTRSKGLLDCGPWKVGRAARQSDWAVASVTTAMVGDAPSAEDPRCHTLQAGIIVELEPVARKNLPGVVLQPVYKDQRQRTTGRAFTDTVKKSATLSSLSSREMFGQPSIDGSIHRATDKPTD